MRHCSSSASPHEMVSGLHRLLKYSCLHKPFENRTKPFLSLSLSLPPSLPFPLLVYLLPSPFISLSLSLSTWLLRAAMFVNNQTSHLCKPGLLSSSRCHYIFNEPTNCRGLLLICCPLPQCMCRQCARVSRHSRWFYESCWTCLIVFLPGSRWTTG